MPDLETLADPVFVEEELVVAAQSLLPEQAQLAELPAASPEVSESYTYTRADGTIESAASVEEARARCPVLGKMSLEQANVMIELAAIGKAKMSQEAVERPEPDKPSQRAANETEKIVKREPERKIVVPEQAVEPAARIAAGAELVARDARRQVERRNVVLEDSVAPSRLSPREQEPTLAREPAIIPSRHEGSSVIQPDLRTEVGSKHTTLRDEDISARTPLVPPVNTAKAAPRECDGLDLVLRRAAAAQEQMNFAAAQVPKDQPGSEKLIESPKPAPPEHNVPLPANTTEPLMRFADLAAVQVVENLSTAIEDRGDEEQVVVADERYWPAVFPEASENVSYVSLAPSNPKPFEADAVLTTAGEEGTMLDTADYGQTAMLALHEEASDVLTIDDSARYEEVAEPTELPEAVIADWGTELAGEPQAIYDDFVEALRPYEVLPETVATQNEVLPTVVAAQDKDLPEATVVRVALNKVAPIAPRPAQPETDALQSPSIAAVVAERLAELEPQDVVLAAPIVHEIVGVIHDVQVLKAQDTVPATIALAEAHLEELCTSLFETVGLEIDEPVIEQFVRTILGPMFHPMPAIEREVVDLDREGTREVKQRLAHIAGGIVNARQKLLQILGMFAIFCVPELASDTR